MKILIDARLWGLEHAGIGRYTVNLISHLQKLDKKNQYIILLRKKYFNRLKFKSNFKKVLAEIPHYSLTEQLKLYPIINSHKPDLVHFLHFNKPLIYKGKYIVTIHDLSMHKRKGLSTTTLNPVKFVIKRKAYKITFKKAVINANHIIVPSKFVQKELARTFDIPENKISVTYEGFTVFPRQPGASKLFPKEKYFLYVGSVYPHKNLERAVEAVQELNKKKEEKVLLLIASKESEFLVRLGNKIKDLNASEYVKLLGFVPDKKLSALYKNAQAFVFPTLLEGFGLPGIEAMAAGTLLLSSDIPTLKEIYKDNCFYFNPYDFTSIEREMHYVLSLTPSQRKKMIAKSQKFVKKYSWQKMAKNTLRVYKKALNA